MKRELAVILCCVLIVAGCGAPQGGSASNEGSTAGSTAGQEEEIAAGTEENAGKAAEKPALEVIGEEEDSFDRAVENRAVKTKADPYAYVLHERAAGPATPGDFGVNKAERKEYTVMVYIVGSNLESRVGAATSDIREMEEAGLDYSKTNLLLYSGGSKRWVSDIPNDFNCVLDLSREVNARIVANTNEAANMGSAETLAEFVNYCTRNYPAEHYGLILWDHGGGPLWGYGSDELFGNDSLTLKELRAAMEETEFGPGHKLDWIGFDACLMGSIENAVLWKDYAQYLVSSEELEAGQGWDYHFLSVLNESQDAVSVTKSIVDAYAAFYEESKSEFYAPDATLSVMDLSRTDAVTDSANVLFDAMKEGIGDGGYASLNQARSRTKAFGLGAVDSVEEAYDLIDLRDFTDQLADQYPVQCGAVAEALDQMVIYSASNVSGAGGVSIYLPGNNRNLYNVSGELRAEEAPLSSQYKGFVDSFTEEWFAESDIAWDLAPIEDGGGELTLQLTEEQAQNASQAYYSIFWRNSGGQYERALLDIPVEADEEGKLHIPEDPMLVTVMSGTSVSGRPWACRQIARKGVVNTYSTLLTYLSASKQMADIDLDVDEVVDIVIKNKEGDRSTKIQDVVTQTGGAWSNGKGSIDISGFTTLMDMAGFGYVPKRTESGEIEPYMSWEHGDSYQSSPVTVDSSFSFVMRPASEFEAEFVCQVVVRDVHDGLHASELIDLPVMSDAEYVEEDTENGVLLYEIFEDHAEVCWYEGSDTEVEISAEVSGKPVTAVASGAFGSNRDKLYEGTLVETVTLPASIKEIGNNAFPYIKQINLPDGLEKIGEGAFRGYLSEEIVIPDSVEMIETQAFESSSLKSVRLPSSLSYIGVMPFQFCEELEEITIDSSNTNYKTVDGVLYTGDGKTLLQYPYSKGSICTIEEGTETIAYGAAADSWYWVESDPHLSEIRFPQTLKTIDSCAFYYCEYLDSLTLPESLEEIGKAAFGMYAMNNEKKTIGTVRIGPNVRKIGAKAFSCLEITAFEVDEKNENYASSGGFITNKSKDTILFVPRGMGETVIIPEGITTLQESVFKELDDSKDYYIPDTVFRFAVNLFGYTTVPEGITIHCSEGSAAQAYAEKYGITYELVEEGSVSEAAARAVFSTEEEERDGCKLLWRVYGDHAALVEMETADEREIFEVPAEYKGLPVTVLGYEHVSEQKLSSASVKKIVIPEGVRSVYAEFLRIWGLKEIEVAKDSQYLRFENNALFSSDGTLIYYQDDKGRTEYTVPDGTKVIGRNAFAERYGDLKKVTMPDTVQSIEVGAFAGWDELTSVTLGAGVENIGYGAFMDCRALKEINLPEGLLKIGDYAFNDTALENVGLPSTVQTIGRLAFTVREGFGEIVLPDSLTYLGRNAFSTDASGQDPYEARQDSLRIPKGLDYDVTTITGILVKNFEVDENSPYHSVTDGLLMSKDGKNLVCVPGQREGELTVPEGTEIIEYGAFGSCPYLTDVYLPDSVILVKDIGQDGYDVACPYKVHCHEGSEAQKQLEANGVQWVKIP